MNGDFISSHDNTKVFINKWEDVKNPLGVVQIFHGMAEYGARYDDFAKFLNSKGYIVFADDHRGHGKTAGAVDKQGYLGENGFDNIVKDEYYITKLIKDKYPSLPVFIFAHSFGSFVGQEYINRYSDKVNGVILCGSAKQTGLAVNAGLLMTKLIRTFGDDSKKAPRLESMIFGSYNKKETTNKLPHAWLCSDEVQVQKYEDDDYCGAVFTTNFYYNMFTGFKGLYEPEKAAKINKDMPLMIIAGDMDPVGSYGKSVKKLLSYYNELNMNNVHMKLYRNCRHELLNEVINKDIYEDIFNFINK